ncbi:MAG TPA: hypothetical protein VGD65_25850 [Chryseosolibacter sp.]
MKRTIFTRSNSYVPSDKRSLNNVPINKTHVKDSIRNPESLFIPFSLLLLVVSIFWWGESLALTIGTTIFIDGITALYLMALALVAYFIVYRITNRFLFSTYLSWAHVIITLATLTVFFSDGKWFLKSQAVSEVQTSIIRQLMINRERTVNFSSLNGMSFLVAQLLFIINFGLGLTRKAQNK